MARRKPKWSALAVTNTALRIGVKVIASVEGGQTFISSPGTDTAVQSDFSSELELCRRPPRPILNQPLNDSATRSVHHRSTHLQSGARPRLKAVTTATVSSGPYTNRPFGVHLACDSAGHPHGPARCGVPTGQHR